MLFLLQASLVASLLEHPEIPCLPENDHLESSSRSAYSICILLRPLMVPYTLSDPLISTTTGLEHKASVTPGVSVYQCPHPSRMSFKGFLSHFLIVFLSTWCQQLSELLSFLFILRPGKGTDHCSVKLPVVLTVT